MQTIKVNLEDSIYQDMLSRGVDIQEELTKMTKKAIYSKEYKIANDITQGIKEVKKGNTKPIDKLLSEL